MVKFFETLKDFISYDEEVFRCELVVSISCDLARPGNVEKIFSLTNVLTLTHSTARLEPVSGAGHRRQGDSPAHAEERGSEHAQDLAVDVCWRPC